MSGGRGGGAPRYSYVELHAHSAYSFLDGASLPDELATAAARHGYPALALTDHDGLHGSLEFAQAAKVAGVRSITGSELTLDDGSHLTLLVEDPAGYRNLCRLLTAAHSDRKTRGSPSLSPDQRNLEQILAFEAALGRFLQFCRDTACFDVDPLEAVQILIARAAEAPIPAPGVDRPLSQGDLVWGLLSSLYARFQWGGLANAIDDALEGDGSRMIRLVDQLWGRNADGTYDNFFEGNVAVNCLDQPVERDTDHHRMLSEQFAEQAPIFGSWGGYLNVTCAVWPAQPSPPPFPTGAGAPPILVIGNTGDPATPLKWAVALSRQLESATLLTNDAEGHTAYLQLNDCIDRIVNAYLLQLEVPAEGTTCGDAGIDPVPPLP